jgi:hypothetical protein
MMTPVTSILFMAFMLMGLGLPDQSDAKRPKQGRAGMEVKALPQQDQMKLALSAAPAHVAKEATAMVYGEDGKLKEAKAGTNGFVCVPTVMNLPEPDPMCMDPSAKQWLDDLIAGAAKPTNTVPGIAYMARGGSHWEKNGRVVLKEEPGAKVVKEPPHWMIMWPFDAREARLPTAPNPLGSYVMFDGTPYAHLMLYQDPRKIK